MQQNVLTPIIGALKPQCYPQMLGILSDISSEFHSVSGFKASVLTARATWDCSKRRSVSHHPSQLRTADFCGICRCSVRMHYFNLVEGTDSLLVEECLLLPSFLMLYYSVCMHVCHWNTWVCSIKCCLYMGLLWREVWEGTSGKTRYICWLLSIYQFWV